MRRIGSLDDGSAARRFCDYLLTLGIDATADNEDGGPGVPWEIWIRNEDDVERARVEWTRFRAAPDAPQYHVEGEVAKIRDERVAEQKRRMATHPPASSGRSGAALGTARPPRTRQQNIPVTIAIIVISVIASFTSHFAKPRGTRDPNAITLEEKTFDMLSFVDRKDYAIAGDSFASIKKGQWWRLVTPMFLHGDEFHLAFNMLWIFFLGSAIERLHGSLFFLALILITQSCGMLLQVMLPDWPAIPESLHGSPFAIGASGAVYGLFGFLWIRPYVDRAYPVHLVPMNVALMLGWLVICLLPTGGNVANGAHIGGLVSGILLAVAVPMMRR